MKNKLVSIIVNCYNGEKYLKNCISSILKQKYQNFEIIFFDNCSSDGSKKIISEYNDKRIKYYYSNKLLPLYKARNEAIKKTTSSLIAFLDVDDWWHETYLSSRVNEFDNENYDYYYSNVYIFYEKNKIYKKYKKYSLPKGKIFNLLAKDYFIIISGLILKKKIFNQVGYFNDNFNIIGDFDLVMRISKSYMAHSINEPLIYYRHHKNNFSKQNSEMFFNEFKEWYENKIKSDDKYFHKNIEHFKKKLNSLEIINLLINKKKNFYLLKKILIYPDLQKKLKYLIAFFIPKKLIIYLML
jgi:glycosyltransferase involved in cell wall biosynthesis